MPNLNFFKSLGVKKTYQTFVMDLSCNVTLGFIDSAGLISFVL